MIQKQLNLLPEQKRNFEFNSLDFRNFLEEIPKSALLINNKTGQVVSANSLFYELVNMGYVEIAGSNISELIPLVDFKNCSDGDKEKTKLTIKNDQSLDIEMHFKFVSQTGNLLLLLFNIDSPGKTTGVNEWENFTKAQNHVLNRIFDLTFEDLIQKFIEIGKQATISDDVIFYVYKQNNPYLKRFPSKSENFPEQIPVLELERIKEIDFWEPGKRVLSEIHRVGRLKGLNSIITIPILRCGQQFGLFILAINKPESRTINIDLINNIATWVTSTLELHEEINQKGKDYLKLNEKAEKLELSFNNSNDCLLLIDKTNKIIEFNTNFLELFGYMPVELLNKNIEVVFEKSPLLTLINENSYLPDEQNSKPIEVFNRHGIKKSVFPKIVSFGLGEAGKKLVILNDKTETVSLENNLLNLQKNAALGEILAEFSHDVRNIINRITTGLQLLVKKINPDETALSSFQEIQDECVEMTDLMESVLSFSRQDYEKFKPENIKEMIERIFYKYQKGAGDANISLILNLLNSEFMAWCDQRSLERVINNLINNGIEAIGKSGGAVSVNLSESEEHSGFLLLQIADTGPGIPPEIQSNLYQKFVSGKSQGTGLGLFISQKIIEYHKGWITLDTFPGGTIFNIYLPKEKRGNPQ